MQNKLNLTDSDINNLYPILAVLLDNEKVIYTKKDMYNLLYIICSIDLGFPKESYEKYFEDLRLRELYGKLEPLQAFCAFLKQLFNSRNIIRLNKYIAEKTVIICDTIKSRNKILEDFTKASDDLIKFTAELCKKLGIKYDIPKTHIKRFSEFEKINDHKL